MFFAFFDFLPVSTQTPIRYDARNVSLAPPQPPQDSLNIIGSEFAWIEVENLGRGSVGEKSGPIAELSAKNDSVSRGPFKVERA